jgi:hypothetical protein
MNNKPSIQRARGETPIFEYLYYYLLLSCYATTALLNSVHSFYFEEPFTN